MGFHMDPKNERKDLSFISGLIHSCSLRKGLMKPRDIKVCEEIVMLIFRRHTIT